MSDELNIDICKRRGWVNIEDSDPDAPECWAPGDDSPIADHEWSIAFCDSWDAVPPWDSDGNAMVILLGEMPGVALEWHQDGRWLAFSVDGRSLIADTSAPRAVALAWVERDIRVEF